MPAEERPPTLQRAAVVVLRLFDVADEVELTQARALIESGGGASGGRRRPGRSAIVLPRPPLSMSLEQRSVTLSGESLEAELSARVYDFGAIAVRLRLALGVETSWARASRLVLAAQEDDSLTRLAREEARRLADRLSPALTGRHDAEFFEDYLVLWCESVGGVDPPPGLVARLLSGEPPDAPLALAEVQEVLRHRSSYDGTDLCVPGWSTALVVEPSGETDVLDLLELANAQLLELRSYDRLLDGALDALYADVGRTRGRGRPFRNYRDLQHRAMALVLELAEFVERVENAIKVVGDTYLARLYGAAVDVLRVPSWQRSVTHKQALLQQLYEVLKHEADASRGLLLEVMVVALILLELLMAVGSR